MMAANSDNNDHNADGKWPYDPSLLTDDFNDDILHLLHSPGGGFDGLYSPPAAAPMPNVTTGGSTLDWAVMPGTGNSSIDGNIPPAAATAIAAPSTSTHQDAVDASTSSVHQGTLGCTGCQILREVVHSNGFETTTLRIHGAAGQFYHATLEVYHANSEGSVPAPTHQSFVDFMGRDYLWVKNYLMDYAQKRAGGGYTVVHDSTSDFHNVLCTSMAGGGHANDLRDEVAAENGVVDQQVPNEGDAGQPTIEQADIVPMAAGPSQPSIVVDKQGQQEVRPAARSRLSVQRERVSKLELHDISRYFHLPVTDACKQLRVCATALKKVSRKVGIERWPYRKVNASDTKIGKLRENGNAGAAAGRDGERS